MKKESTILILYVTTIALSFASSFVEEKKAFFERNKHLDGHVEYFALTSPERELKSVEFAHFCRMSLYDMEDEDKKTEDMEKGLIEVRDRMEKMWKDMKKEMPSGSYLVKCKFIDPDNRRSFWGHIVLYNGESIKIIGGDIIGDGKEFPIK